jgi:hypothetical protein
MKRCNECFRYAVGQPTYCPFCGRSYNVRICSRGHVNARHVQFCTTCGNTDLSTPAAAEGRLARLSRWSLKLVLAVALVGVALALLVGILASIDWSSLAGPLVTLVFMYGFLYWTTTLLPGPVKKVGRAAGRKVVTMVRNKRTRTQ